MNHDDIIRMATEIYGPHEWTEHQAKQLERFSRLVEAHVINTRQVHWYETGYADGLEQERRTICSQIAQLHDSLIMGLDRQGLKLKRDS
jgi:hypothetical protein